MKDLNTLNKIANFWGDNDSLKMSERNKSFPRAVRDWWRRYIWDSRPGEFSKFQQFLAGDDYDNLVKGAPIRVRKWDGTYYDRQRTAKDTLTEAGKPFRWTQIDRRSGHPVWKIQMQREIDQVKSQMRRDELAYKETHPWDSDRGIASYDYVLNMQRKINEIKQKYGDLAYKDLTEGR